MLRCVGLGTLKSVLAPQPRQSCFLQASRPAHGPEQSSNTGCARWAGVGHADSPLHSARPRRVCRGCTHGAGAENRAREGRRGMLEPGRRPIASGRRCMHSAALMRRAKAPQHQHCNHLTLLLRRYIKCCGAEGGTGRGGRVPSKRPPKVPRAACRRCGPASLSLSFGQSLLSPPSWPCGRPSSP